MIYEVTAKRWAKGWELHITDVGVTQVRTLNDAEDMARDYIGSLLDIPDADIPAIDVEITPELPAELAARVTAAKTAVRSAEENRKAAAVFQRDVARELKDAGLTQGETAVILGVSPQRVSQLLKEKETA